MTAAIITETYLAPNYGGPEREQMQTRCVQMSREKAHSPTCKDKSSNATNDWAMAKVKLIYKILNIDYEYNVTGY